MEMEGSRESSFLVREMVVTGVHRRSSRRKKPNKAAGTKKCNYYFALKGRKLATDDDWMATVLCGVHNHPNSQYLEGTRLLEGFL